MVNVDFLITSPNYCSLIQSFSIRNSSIACHKLLGINLKEKKKAVEIILFHGLVYVDGASVIILLMSCGGSHLWPCMLINELNC